jgi:hypothetical protein
MLDAIADLDATVGPAVSPTVAAKIDTGSFASLVTAQLERE